MNSIAIIDLDSIMFSIGNPNKVLDENGQPLKQDNKFVYKEKTLDELVESADFIMNKILNNCKCKYYIAYIKGTDTTKTKRLIDPNYKANRPNESPKWWEFVKRYLITSWGATPVNDIEVDDACNITRLALKESFMVCIDSDLLGLEGTHYRWRNKSDLSGEWITVTKIEEDFKIWYEMITGSHNNTKGIPGKGVKYCQKIFNNWTMNSSELRNTVFNEYITYFGEERGIEEFYKNYKMIKILDKYEGFQLPELIEFKNRIK